MDKLKLTGRNLGRVCKSKLGHVFEYAMQSHTLQKGPNLKLKTRPQQLLGSLPLAFALPAQTFKNKQVFKFLQN